jgi:hypothetical protein
VFGDPWFFFLYIMFEEKKVVGGTKMALTTKMGS